MTCVTCSQHRFGDNSHRDIQDLHVHMPLLMAQYGVGLPQLPGLPGFDFLQVEGEWSHFRNNIPEFWKFNNDGRELKVGEQTQARRLSAKYPVNLVLGIISTVRPAFHAIP